ncbi:acyl-[ACP]--phospholipid O-acyltransferase [Planctomyces sp. SH-PL14]|uniref:acyl-[ACP]--phospholipid O-acyltransferase n=1 Tax=Planctomyces sp. SH-PL14 TaxID=1632864 RepID=UPI00078CEF54|nr:acyl-[ACP]--phospholipid O-acyltransferase [Planctomyces sp. SH-PL14]AMV17663.1 Bifunctional protein Aas [Planctomyces sp. SH-PL14]
MSPPSDSLPPPPDSPLRNRSFLGLVLTQLLGCINDNVFKWLSVCYAMGTGRIGSDTALVLGAACFTIPYLLLAPFSGSLADRYSKRVVIVACKVAEVVIMALAILALVLGNLTFLYFLVFLIGAQSALFAPSKYGAIPEMLPPPLLTAGNGWMGLVTVCGSALGMIGGYSLYGVVTPSLGGGLSPWELWPVIVALIGMAVAGTATAIMIEPLVAASPTRPLEIDPFSHTLPALRTLARETKLFRTALGIGFFWFLASLAQLNADPLGKEWLHLPQQSVGMLMAVLVLGLGGGSLLAGKWSEGKVELGIVPIGALGVVISSVLVYLTGRFVTADAPATHQVMFYLCAASLCLLGASAGLFDVPLESYLQHRTDPRLRGMILAATNFVVFLGILLSAAVFFVLKAVLGISPGAIFALAGLGTIPILIYALRLMPEITARFVFWLASHTVYRLQVVGRENIPERGGALIVANHVSWVDGILMLTSSSRFVRFLVYADYVRNPLLTGLAKVMHVIPIKASEGPRSIVMALKTAKEAVANGELVCIFAEGALTRTGQLQPFQRGLMKIVEGTNAPVIPAYLHGLWGSVFSFAGGKFFWKWPKHWPYRVAVHFGKPMPQPDDVSQVRLAVEQLGVDAVKSDKPYSPIPAVRFVQQCRETGKRIKVADSLGQEVSGTMLLLRTIIARRILERTTFAPDEQNIGILLPPSTGGCIANMAVSLSKRVAVNLNYTLSDDTLNYCIRTAGIKHILTSRQFLDRRPFKPEGAEFVFLDDLKDKVTKMDKAVAGLMAYALPTGIVTRMLGLHSVDPDETLSIIFTSGSTGEPKGVMLSHHNVASNIDAVDQLLHLEITDGLMGILPFFHSFGYTASMWLPLCFEPKGVYHFNPLDAKTIGKLVEKHKATILMSTPTFLKSYIKRVEPSQFASLDMVVVGAEKLPTDLAHQFHEKFKVMPSEGYGTTELSPVAAVNIPDHRSSEVQQKGTKLGTVGRPLPGVAAKVIDPDTGADLGVNREGLLLIKGPNVMKGYLQQPDKTAAVIRDGWYVTGDFAKLDDEGFIEITGRQSRFSKIGGEMVPHILLEEHLTRLTEDPSDEDAELRLAVTAVSDPNRGERLIVLHKPLKKPVPEVLKELSAMGLPNLWLPSADCFFEVERIPLLGTGKLDLKGIKDLAIARTQAS